MIKLFVGLGNPGPPYKATRHNAGAWWIEAVAAQLKTHLTADKSMHGLVARIAVAGAPVWLLQPQTFMNLSGKSVSALARFYKVEPQEVLVAYDELDIAPGEAKLKLGGSSTHNGLRDIREKMGTADFWRLRIGIGHPGVKEEVLDWVLQKPSPDHRAATRSGASHSQELSSIFGASSRNERQSCVYSRLPSIPILSLVGLLWRVAARRF